jgi:hypothetical protein
MKIRESSEDKQADESRRRELLNVLCEPSDKEQRPCSSCNKVCACDLRSRSCPCECSMDCPDAPRFLSSDPERYPIEPKVVPLVYAMSTLRQTPPCWSCEGHLTEQGGLVRLPQVWFYSATTIYPELISDYLHKLAFRKETTYAWVVSVCPHTESNATTFTLMPNQSIGSNANEEELRQMQNDLHTISYSLRDGVIQVAKKKLSKMNSQGNSKKVNTIVARELPLVKSG